MEWGCCEGGTWEGPGRLLVQVWLVLLRWDPKLLLRLHGLSLLSLQHLCVE